MACEGNASVQPVEIRHHTLDLALNPHRRYEACPPELDTQLPRSSATEARAVLRAWPGYCPTPLRELPGLATALGVRSVHCKDEGARFGLGSFKALGGAYAVYRIAAARAVAEQEQENLLAASQIAPLPSPKELASGSKNPAVKKLTFACATAGNHGRSVAWGAAMFGAQCVVYMHKDVPAVSEAAVAALGARVVRLDGNYDASVAQLAADAAKEGWVVVADTAWPGYEAVPRDIKLGYTLTAQEAAEQLADEENARFTHVIVQAGVGGLAAAVVSCLWSIDSGTGLPPRFLVVEPAGAACHLASCRKGKAVPLTGNVHSVMTGLACGVPSPIAWPVLDAGVDAFAAIPDAAANDAQRALMSGELGAVISSGPSGAAGVAALLALAEDENNRQKLGLGPDSRVLVFVTEAGLSE